MEQSLTPNKKQLIAELWLRGNLSWKCHSIQKEMYDIFYGAKKRSNLVWLLARQSGKSTLLAILALEQALRQKNSVVKLVTDTKLHVKTVFEKIFEELLQDCPQEIKPQFNSKYYTYYFTNGSQIQLAGTDNKHYERLRGQKAHLVLIDEAGFCNDLRDVVDSVLFPTTTHTGGNIILASTPPEDEDHPFLYYLEKAELQGYSTKKTIYENPLLTPEEIEDIAEKMGGKNSERFRREYLCELIRSASTSVVPEFTKDLEDIIIKEWPKPPFYDCYVSMDLGGKDLTVVLFGYYDFRADKVVIEDELVVNFTERGNTIESLTKGIQDKENKIWFNPFTNEVKKPYQRISDINYIVVGEILKYSNHQISFVPAKKDDKEAAINNLRTLVGGCKVIINPKCQTLIRHLKNVKWANKNKDSFARSPDDGHYDAVDALKYLLRTVVFNKNPYPKNYGIDNTNLFIKDPKSYNESSNANVFKKIFNIKR